MNIFHQFARTASTDDTAASPREASDWAGEADGGGVPRPFVAEDFEDEFEGEGWSFWGD